MDIRIDQLQRRAAENSKILSLAGGLPLSSLFPMENLQVSHLTMSPEEQEQALQYNWPEGREKLRTWVVGRLASQGASIDPADVIITSGAQQALSLVAEVLDFHDKEIGVAPETYPGALDLFRRKAAKLTPSLSAQAYYVVTGSSNPRGLGLDPTQRQRLLDSSCPIIEDTAYAELRYDGQYHRPLIADAAFRVFHVGTLSKTLCPGVRLGWLIAPARYRQKLIEAKRDADLQTPSLTQALVEQVLEKLDWEAHLARARRAYLGRMERLTDAVLRYLPEFYFTEPEGGFSLFVWCDDVSLDEIAILDFCTRQGTSFDPGSMFRHDMARLPFAMRLCPCNVPENEIGEAVRRLAGAIAKVRHTKTSV